MLVFIPNDAHRGEMLFFKNNKQRKKEACLFHFDGSVRFIASLQTEILTMTLSIRYRCLSVCLFVCFVFFPINNHIIQWFHSASSQNTVANISMCIRVSFIECNCFFCRDIPESVWGAEALEGCLFLGGSRCCSRRPVKLWLYQVLFFLNFHSIKKKSKIVTDEKIHYCKDSILWPVKSLNTHFFFFLSIYFLLYK